MKKINKEKRVKEKHKDQCSEEKLTCFILKTLFRSLLIRSGCILQIRYSGLSMKSFIRNTVQIKIKNFYKPLNKN